MGRKWERRGEIGEKGRAARRGGGRKRWGGGGGTGGKGEGGRGGGGRGCSPAIWVVESFLLRVTQSELYPTTANEKLLSPRPSPAHAAASQHALCCRLCKGFSLWFGPQLLLSPPKATRCTFPALMFTHLTQNQPFSLLGDRLGDLPALGSGIWDPPNPLQPKTACVCVYLTGPLLRWLGGHSGGGEESRSSSSATHTSSTPIKVEE